MVYTVKAFSKNRKRQDIMNSELKNVVSEIIVKYGESVFYEPKRVSALLADLGQEAPRPQKTALIKSLEHGFVKILKDVPAPERNVCKQKLARKLNEEEGLELRLCEETLELLAAVLCGEEQKKKDNICKNCGKELQKDWTICPYCRTEIENTSGLSKETTPQKDDTVSSSSGGTINNQQQIKPVTTSLNNIQQEKYETNVYKKSDNIKGLIITLLLLGLLIIVVMVKSNWI